MDEYKDYLIELTSISSFEGFPTSDTIFGAICWAIRMLPADEYGEQKLRQLLNDFSTRAKFIPSSSFPVLGNNDQRVYFFPNPFTEDLPLRDIKNIAKKLKEDIISSYHNDPNLSKNLSPVVVSEAKTFKKAQYASVELFREILAGTSKYRLFATHLEEKNWRMERFKPKHKDLGGKYKLLDRFLLTSDEYTSLFREEARPEFLKEAIVQKNALNRINWSTEPGGETFYSHEFYNLPNFKLFFLLRTSMKIDWFTPIFRYLEDTGIGGNRSIGKNHFKISLPAESKFDFLSANGNQKKFVTLSRFFAGPEEFEVDDEKKRPCYELFAQRLKVESRLEFTGVNWKNLIFYFKEGSVFYAKENKPYYGSINPVKKINDKEIMQNCIAFPVFFQEKEK